MKWNLIFIIVLLFCGAACSPDSMNEEVETSDMYWMVLGVAQDAGYPQAACRKSCCQLVRERKQKTRTPACLALVDEVRQQYWLWEATPNIRRQLQLLYDNTNIPEGQLPEGIFLTHAHIGHYTGLMQLGREVIGADGVAVYAMPKMASFLSQNGPWSQLVELGNITLKPLVADSVHMINSDVKVRPMLVPHRDEFSETVGYVVDGGDSQLLFIPDIDKWGKWDRSITEVISEVDVAFLDATFYSNGELPNRDMSEIPHPFVEESMDLFQELGEEDKSKVHFIHFNHTNPLLFSDTIRKEVEEAGFHVAMEGMRLNVN